MGNANDQGAAIFGEIVDAIGNGDSDRIGAEVVIIDATGSALPTTAGIFEVAHEFTLFAVDADNRQMTVLEAVPQLGEVFELEITVGAGVGGDLLVIDVKRIAHLMEQAGDRVGRDGNAEFAQFLGNGGGGAARPA